jgi:hypothetical protein
MISLRCDAVPARRIYRSEHEDQGSARDGGSLRRAGRRRGVLQPDRKSWAITYEVIGQSSGTLAKVGYANSPDRYQDEIAQQTVQGPVGVPWKQDVVVAARQKAEITATPTGGRTLTCRILLDAQKELARATAPGPGQPVSCARTTGS